MLKSEYTEHTFSCDLSFGLDVNSRHDPSENPYSYEYEYLNGMTPMTPFRFDLSSSTDSLPGTPNSSDDISFMFDQQCTTSSPPKESYITIAANNECSNTAPWFSTFGLNENFHKKVKEEIAEDDQLRDMAARNTTQRGSTIIIDVSCLLGISQKRASKILNIPNSTLSKRWRDTTNNRKWPCRTIRKLNQSIQILEENIPHSPKSEELESSLSRLRSQRDEECKPIFLHFKHRSC